MSKIIFYGLLYFSKVDKNPNLGYIDKNKKDKIFANNALNLAHSLKKQDLDFILITNDQKRLRDLVDYDYPVKKIKFKKVVNYNTDFFSAHFKIDVIKYLQKKNQTSCLLDLDILAINKIPTFLKTAAKKKRNLVFDLNDRKDKILNQKIINSLYKCNQLTNNYPNWYGGEFIFGDKIFFKYISKKINLFYPNYLKNIDSVHHIGDEMLLNSALQSIKIENKIKFYDVSNKKVIGRYWSINTKKKLKKLDYYLKNFLIHLPSDKLFLSQIKVNELNYNEIKKMYKSKVFSLQNVYTNKLKKIIRKIL